MSAAGASDRKTPIVAMLLAVLCLVWLLVAAWGAAQYRSATHFGPVLHDPLSLAVDPADGTIYCASGAGRIQKYGPDGRGRGAFPVETGGEAFRIRAEGPNRIAMAVAGRDRVLVFDPGGRPVGERTEPGAWADWAASAREADASGEGEASGAVDRQVFLRDGAIVAREGGRGGDEQILVPAVEFPLSLFAGAPWLLVVSLFCATLGMMAAFVWPFLARPDDDAVR